MDGNPGPGVPGRTPSPLPMPLSLSAPTPLLPGGRLFNEPGPAEQRVPSPERRLLLEKDRGSPSPERVPVHRDSAASDGSLLDDADELMAEAAAAVQPASADQVAAFLARAEGLVIGMAGLKLESEPPLPSPLDGATADSLLVLDVRPRDAFARQRLAGSVSVALPPLFSRRIRRNPRATKFALDSFVSPEDRDVLDAWRERVREGCLGQPTVLLVDEDMSSPSLECDGWTLALLLQRNMRGSTPLPRLPISRVSSLSPERSSTGGSVDGPPRVEITRADTTTSPLRFVFLNPGFEAILAHPLASAILSPTDEDYVEEEPPTPLSSTTLPATPGPAGDGLERSSSFSGRRGGSSLTINTDGPRARRSRSLRSRPRDSPATLRGSGELTTLGSRDLTPAGHASSSRGNTPLKPPPSDSLPNSPGSAARSASGSPSPGSPPPPYTRIRERLYLGTDEPCAPAGWGMLAEMRATHVLNVAVEVDDVLPPGTVGRKVGVPDSAGVDCGRELRDGVAWIGTFAGVLLPVPV
ncbi:hypothetical protein DFJ74DRAFT_335444 [Hyaloraphidium curvatum]|nr:hypothetical protein DFJ74DRAFT_335444 [Hyaloraphidium curvatum]